MNRLKLFTIGAVLFTLIGGCKAKPIKGDPLSHNMTIDDPMGIAVAGSKNNAIDRNCFYDGQRPNLPPSNATDVELQYSAIGIHKGRIARFVPPGAAGQLNNDQTQVPPASAQWNQRLDNLPRQAFGPLRKQIPPSVPNGNPNFAQNVNPNFANNPSQLDMSLYYHTKLTFQLIEDGWTFNADNPLDVFSGDPGEGFLPPFYFRSEKFNADKTQLYVEYYSLPPSGGDENAISNRVCIYDYALNVDITDDDGRAYTTQIIIDPGAGNKGNP